jgi:hypothetical protein
MESDPNLDLPPEIVEQLKNLELELQDGDITLKGFEKKKASLLADMSPRSTVVVQPSDAEILAELGPEPSAADVVDFLDFLPSPTHSPTRTVEAVQLMEQNHRQIQQQPQPQLQPATQLQYNNTPNPTLYYNPPPPTPNHQKMYYSAPNPAYRPGPNTYYPDNTPVPNNNRTYAPPRPAYPQNQVRPIPSGYYGRPPTTNPPQHMMYRPLQRPPPPPVTVQPLTTSPRPMYRPPPSTNSNNYRPQFGNYNNYNSSDMRSFSTDTTSSSTMVNQYDQRQYYRSR